MSVRAAADKSYEDLKQALAEGKLPTHVADTAVKLLDRLHQPVRVSVMGLPGSGKSAIVNLLLNKIAIPDGVRLPTSQFLKGDVAKAICTLSEGATKTVIGADPHEIAALDPMFVKFQLPLPALGRISVLEVVAPETPKDQQRAMHWAAKRTDIALWCTESFTSLEQALWQSLPEQVKDHAMMLVTKADILDQTGNRDKTVAEINYTYAHQFNKIMPIATTDAIAARRADGTVDKPMLQQSGGLTLISSILRQVDRGLQATVDQSDLIMHKYRDATPNPDAARFVDKIDTPRPVSELLPEPTPVAPSQDAPVVNVESSRPVATGASQPIVAADTPDTADAFVLRSVKTKPAPEQPKDLTKLRSVRPVTKEVAPAPAAEQPKRPRPGFMPKTKSTAILRAKPETREAYNEAIAYLSTKGRELTEQLASDAGLSSDALMAASADNIMWLTDYLDDVKVTNDPILDKTRTRALDASELIQLMQFEKNDGAGIEALSLVIQLKRDLEAEVAMSMHAAQTEAA